MICNTRYLHVFAINNILDFNVSKKIYIINYNNMIYLPSRLDRPNHQIKFSSNCFPKFLWMVSMNYDNYLLIPLYYRVTMRNGRLTQLTNLLLIRKFNFHVRQMIVLLCIFNITSSIQFF